MRKFTLYVIVAIFGVAPLAALADHTTPHTIEQLQAQIQALQAQLRQLQILLPPSISVGNIPAFTEVDMKQGWYWGNRDQRKPGTPSTWLLRYEGTRSAQWYDPNTADATATEKKKVPTFNRDLYFGLSNDSDIIALQEFLTEQGYYAGPISGNFGSLTLSAVKKFQLAKGINSTGYFGPRSRAVPNAIMQKLVGQICLQEGSCEGNVLPIAKISITAASELGGTVGEQLTIKFSASGGSGEYSIQAIDGGVPGLKLEFFCKTGGSDCPKNNFVLTGVPAKNGVFSITILVQDITAKQIYGKERFTIVIKEKISAAKPPMIAGVKGPTTLKVGEEGVWTINAQDPSNGTLVYRVIWGDEVYQKEAASSAVSQRAIPFKQTFTFAHTYYSAGVYSPTFYVVNDRGSEVKTSISVTVKESSMGVGTTLEKVKCIFSGSQSEQKCFTAVTDTSNIYYNRGCSGVGSCIVDIKGYKGDSILWKSSCVEGYAYTTVDGLDESAYFKCGTLY